MGKEKENMRTTLPSGVAEQVLPEFRGQSSYPPPSGRGNSFKSEQHRKHKHQRGMHILHASEHN